MDADAVRNLVVYFKSQEEYACVTIGHATLHTNTILTIVLQVR